MKHPRLTLVISCCLGLSLASCRTVAPNTAAAKNTETPVASAALTVEFGKYDQLKDFQGNATLKNSPSGGDVTLTNCLKTRMTDANYNRKEAMDCSDGTNHFLVQFDERLERPLARWLVWSNPPVEHFFVCRRTSETYNNNEDYQTGYTFACDADPAATFKTITNLIDSPGPDAFGRAYGGEALSSVSSQAAGETFAALQRALPAGTYQGIGATSASKCELRVNSSDDGYLIGLFSGLGATARAQQTIAIGPRTIFGALSGTAHRSFTDPSTPASGTFVAFEYRPATTPRGDAGKYSAGVLLVAQNMALDGTSVQFQRGKYCRRLTRTGGPAVNNTNSSNPSVGYSCKKEGTMGLKMVNPSTPESGISVADLSNSSPTWLPAELIAASADKSRFLIEFSENGGTGHAAMYVHVDQNAKTATSFSMSPDAPFDFEGAKAAFFSGNDQTGFDLFAAMTCTGS